jgi:hypothetical protein
MLIDAFPIFNEIELAKFRISYLSNLVDKVLIAESHLTNTGNSKPLYFSEWLSKNNSFKSNVEVIYVPHTLSMESMERDIFTREYLINYLIKKYPHAKYILSDLDEIPSTDQIRKLLNSSGNFHFKTPTSYRRLNWLLIDNIHAEWSRGVMGDVKFAEKSNAGRFNKMIPLINGESGAHFSWLAKDSKSIYEKIKSTAHTELNKPYWRSDKIIVFCDKYKIDHLGRARNKGFGLLRIEISKKNNSVIFAAKKELTELFDNNVDTPKKLLRIYASVKLSVYLGQGFLSKISQKLFKIDYFLESKNIIIIIIVSVEYFMILFNNFCKKYHLRH